MTGHFHPSCVEMTTKYMRVHHRNGVPNSPRRISAPTAACQRDRTFPPGGTSAPEITIADISPSPKLGSTQRDRTFSLLPQNPKSTRSCPNISVEIGMLERRRPARAIIFRPDADSRRYQARRRRRETGPRSAQLDQPSVATKSFIPAARSPPASAKKSVARCHLRGR